LGVGLGGTGDGEAGEEVGASVTVGAPEDEADGVGAGALMHPAAIVAMRSGTIERVTSMRGEVVVIPLRTRCRPTCDAGLDCKVDP
jgi:hypothetical protein